MSSNRNSVFGHDQDDWFKERWNRLLKTDCCLILKDDNRSIDGSIFIQYTESVAKGRHNNRRNCGYVTRVKGGSGREALTVIWTQKAWCNWTLNFIYVYINNPIVFLNRIVSFFQIMFLKCFPNNFLRVHFDMTDCSVIWKNMSIVKRLFGIYVNTWPNLITLAICNF